MMFLEEIRPLIEMKFPGQTFAEISQIAALMWQKLTDDEKNEYKKAAEGLYMSRSNLRTHKVCTLIQATAMRTERRRAATSPTRRAARPPRTGAAAATRTWETTTTMPSSVNIMSLEIASSVMQG